MQISPGASSETTSTTYYLIIGLFFLSLILFVLLLIALRRGNIKEKKAKAKIESILERITDAFVAIDKDWCYTFMNQKAAEIFNRDAKAMIGKHIWTEFPEGVGQPFYHAYYKAMNEQRYIYLEEYYPPYDRWFENHIYPSPKGLSIFFKDISERKKAEISLIQSEERYRKIVETAQEGIWMVDENEKTIFVNSHLAEMLGYEPQEIIGKTFFEFLTDDGKEFAKANIERRRKGENRRVKTEYKYKKKNGDILWAIIAVNPIFKDGQYKGSLAMLMDITEQRKAQEQLIMNEKQLSLIFNTVSDAVFLLDCEGNRRFKFAAVNNSFIQTTQTEKENIIGKYVDELIPKHSLNLVLHNYFKAIETKKTVTWENVSEYKSGIKTAYVSITPVFDDRGNCIELVGSMHDITERKTAEIEREKITRNVIQRNNDLEQFTYIVSHNVRGPVANIMGCVNILNNFNLDEDSKKQFMNGLSTSVKKLDQVIQDLNHILQLKFNLEEKKELINLPRLVNDIKLSVDTLIQKEKVEFVTNFEVEEIFSIRTYIYSIFYNLISNSIKYRKEDIPPVIEIRTKKIDNGVEIYFQDNGIGIDLKTKREQVFGLYKRFHTHKEGKGMGLFMAKAQVEALGGKISVESEVKKGTLFCVQLEDQPEFSNQVFV